MYDFKIVSVPKTSSNSQAKKKLSCHFEVLDLKEKLNILLTFSKKIVRWKGKVPSCKLPFKINVLTFLPKED